MSDYVLTVEPIWLEEWLTFRDPGNRGWPSRQDARARYFEIAGVTPEQFTDLWARDLIEDTHIGMVWMIHTSQFAQ